MEAIKNALDFSDFPRIDLVVASCVLLFLLAFPIFPLSSFAMATMIQFMIFSIYLTMVRVRETTPAEVSSR